MPMTSEPAVFRAAAVPEAMPAARDFVTRALTGHNLDPRVVRDAVVAVSEALTNAVRHSGTDRLEVVVAPGGPGRVVVRILDRGRGFEPPSDPTMPAPTARQGRGLALMEALVDGVEIHTTPGGGTEVVLTVGG